MHSMTFQSPNLTQTIFFYASKSTCNRKFTEDYHYINSLFVKFIKILYKVIITIRISYTVIRS